MDQPFPDKLETKPHSSKRNSLVIKELGCQITNSIDTVTSHQWTNPVNITHLEEPVDNIIEKDLGHMQANERLF